MTTTTHTKNLAKKKKKVIHGDHYHLHSPFSNLPADILIKILCKLPTKTICQCKLVCKEWLDIVNDTHFAESHHNLATPTLCVLSYDCNNSDSIYLSEVCKKKQKQGYRNVLLSSRFRVGGFTKGLVLEVVNSCRGFLLIRTQDMSSFCFDLHVYNPLTGEHLKLPQTQTRTDNPMTTMLGLGFSHVRKEYKVVRFVNMDNMTELYVHVVGTNVWKTVLIKEGKYSLPSLMRVFTRGEKQPLEINGVLHWLDAHQKIVCFDVDKEELGFMYVPCLGDSVKYIVSIGTVCGLLYVGIIVLGNSRNGAEIWVMREYGVTESWTKYVVLKDYNVGTGLTVYSKPKLVDVWDNEEIVVLSQYPLCNLRAYSRREERSKRRIKIKTSNQKMTAEVYIPSFFSIRTHMLANATICSN